MSKIISDDLENHPKKLLVEGATEERLIPELMEKNGIDWGTKENPVVYIKKSGGYPELSKKGVMVGEIQSPDCLSALGIIIDADKQSGERWQSIRNVCLESIANIPDRLPEEGLILPEAEVTRAFKTIKFGIWMMPNNKKPGMLETFLPCLVPDTKEPLWNYTEEVVGEAKQRGAPFRDVDTDKARMYSWLAWQESPGRQLHDAVKQRILDPNHPRGQAFVRWFKDLYDL